MRPRRDHSQDAVGEALEEYVRKFDALSTDLKIKAEMLNVHTGILEKAQAQGGQNG